MEMVQFLFQLSEKKTENKVKQKKTIKPQEKKTDFWPNVVVQSLSPYLCLTLFFLTPFFHWLTKA